jgi:hypothetical protein
MAEMVALKAQLRDQNERLLKVTQEKAKMDAKNKARQAQLEEGRTDELTEFDIKKKQKEEHVIELRAKLAALKDTEEVTRNKYLNEKDALDNHRDSLKKIIETCKSLYTEFDEKRRDIKAEKSKRIRELTDPDHAWDTVVHDNEPEMAAVSSASVAPAAHDYIEYRALYDYESDNPDDLVFKAGDILRVHPEQPHEPGWLGGEINGKIGWFPEAYAEPYTADSGAALQEAKPVVADSTIQARVLYNWTTDHPETELTIARNEMITVTSQADPDWWFGQDGMDKEGYFPANHVTLEDMEARGSTPTEAPDIIGSSPQKPVEAAAAASSEVLYVALHPYNSEEPGDLIFEAGEEIEVIKKEAEWWTGKIGDRTGVFPFNYVEAVGGHQTNEVSCLLLGFDLLFTFLGHDHLTENLGLVCTIVSCLFLPASQDAGYRITL